MGGNHGLRLLALLGFKIFHFFPLGKFALSCLDQQGAISTWARFGRETTQCLCSLLYHSFFRLQGWVWGLLRQDWATSGVCVCVCVWACMRVCVGRELEGESMLI